MRIHHARLLIRAARAAQFPRAGQPEFAFIGRSNVGKSRLLNALVGRRGLARISSTPGCTRSIHFFLLNRRLLFVDLPGYGYTRVPKDVQAAWKPLAEAYLTDREPLRLVWVLSDARHAPTEQDRQMVDWLRSAAIPFRVAQTKGDKLSGGERGKSRRRCIETLGLTDQEAPIVTSARSGMGLREMWKEIDTRARERTPAGDGSSDATQRFERRDAASSGG
jgi:GTP-binding protein